MSNKPKSNVCFERHYLALEIESQQFYEMNELIHVAEPTNYFCNLQFSTKYNLQLVTVRIFVLR